MADNDDLGLRTTRPTVAVTRRRICLVGDPYAISSSMIYQYHGNLRGPPQCHPPQEIAGVIKGLLTTIVP